MQVPDSGTVEPSQQTIRAFVACIEEGNKCYDSAGCRGCLSVYGAIESACSDMNVTIARRRRFWRVGLRPVQTRSADYQRQLLEQAQSILVYL